MIKLYIRYFAIFAILTLLQALVLNKIQISGYLNPYLYIFFILILPIDIPGWALLLLGMVAGFALDLFTNTIGMHASATLFLAFMRPYVLSAISPREGFDATTVPSAAQYGMLWFLKYAIIMVLIHHFALFMIEVWSFSHFFGTLLRWILSSFLTILLVMVAELLTFNKKDR